MGKISLTGPRRLLAGMLVLLGGLSLGCDSGSGTDGGGASGPPVPGRAQPNPTVTVNLESASASMAGLAQFRVLALDIRGAQLASRTVDAGGPSASFEGLPAGSLQMRVIGMDQNSTVLGYADLDAAVPGATQVSSKALTPGALVPPPATPGAPFLAFTALPASYQGGVLYSLEISAFNAQGQLDTTAAGSVGLSASGTSPSQASQGATLSGGRAVFSNLSFPSEANGAVTFTASSAGLQSVSSPTLPVRSR